jgi:lipopolysaccharide/colanic/teichoic acid biosynthesis glycosyltransferase
MKTGPDYSASFEKRAFDITFSSLLLPAKKVGEIALRRAIENSTGLKLEPVLLQKRMGYKHNPFDIHKFLTLYPGTDIPIDDWAGLIRRLGLDELAQLYNIRKGEMSFTGPRPLEVGEYEEIRDMLGPKKGTRWANILLTARPGLYSSYGLYSHTTEENKHNIEEWAEIRADFDLRDSVDASVAHDILITAQFLGHALSRGLK